MLWQPSKQFTEFSNMFAYAQFLKREKNLQLNDYQDLWQWSVNNIGAFWESIWEYYDVMHDGTYKVSLQKSSEMMDSLWFEGTQLNYAEHIFRNKTSEFPAILFQSETQSATEISWKELEEKVAALANYFKAEGIVKGDRIAAYLPNTPEALIAFLAANALGAVWSSCSPDFGTASVIDRLSQIEPKILIACNSYSYNGKSFPKADTVAELAGHLKSLKKTLVVGSAEWLEIMNNKSATLQFTRVDFNHPIWILYSSGTTGKPKAITHSVGGMLIEHLKAMGLHQNCKKGDKFFWYSTTGWMMWNYANAALLHGTTVVIYDGAPAYPSINVLWDLAEKTKITHFGAGASFYISCMKAGLDYSSKLNHIQSLGSTGSPLPPEAFDWIYKCVKKDLWLISLSGGTDICSGFVGGNPFEPVYAGEIQCRLLGCKVEAYNENGQAVYDELGEMVIEEPMPSMPIYFWNDANNEKYKSSYFEMYPGKWRHGDWIKITARKSVIIFGRSDATLNRGGVRIGTSEVYSAVESVVEVKDSMVICTDEEGGEHYMPLFVVLREGFALDDALKSKIKSELRKQYSPRHVPDEIFQVSEIPYTISGKKMETPVKKILMGTPLEKAVTQDAMKNPESLKFFVEFVRNRK
ncbi:MAG: acetoacetate--CoA ligase [Bacteroidetes bacterium]|nr:acetoacetate--CoA ligase [Bacteroidota bacterium]